VKPWKLHILFLAGSWVSAGAGTAWAQCGGGLPVNRNAIFHVVNVPIQPHYYHNLSTAQIEGLQNSVKFTSRNLQEPGLTCAEQSLDTNYQCGAMENMQTRRFCVWADSVEVDFSYTKMDVYISSQYLEGTCPYRVILAHENQHVAINNRTLRKYVELMKQAVRRDRTIPTKDRPITVGSFKEGQDIIASRISRIIQPLYERYKREVLAENRKIDTMRNYRRIQAQCHDW
jgi:hypothetical protein